MLEKMINILLIGIFTLGAQPLLADGGDSSDWGGGAQMKPIQQLIEQQKFAQAIEKLDAALAASPDNADLLNLLAFSHRKLEHFERALDYYQQALQIEPKHRGANEYLGELYLRLGQLEKAQQRLEVLDKACFFGCDEYDELKQAIEEYRRANPT